MSKISKVYYSLILYFTEVLEDDIETIKDYIKNGITIHLFLTNTIKEELAMRLATDYYLFMRIKIRYQIIMR